MRFTTKASFYVEHCRYTFPITVENKDGKVFVDGEEAEMIYNGIQLRFELVNGERCYFIFDDEHLPPKPIRQMYKDLGGQPRRKE